MKGKKMLSRVTVTGADDSVEVGELFELRNKYPFVEFGILLSQGSGHEGRTRFPSHEWLRRLVSEVRFGNPPMQLSGHICGNWVREAFLGEWPKLDCVVKGLGKVFQRFQLNTHGEPHVHTSMLYDQIARMKDDSKTIIFQLDGRDGSAAARAASKWLNSGNIAGLFDLSHGTGVLPAEWENPPPYLPYAQCGYAGGLSPDNVAHQLEKIQRIDGDGFWIDAETGIRSRDGMRFDLDLADKFLKAASPWVKPMLQ